MDLKDFAPKSDEVEVVVKHPANGEPLVNKDGSNMVIVLHAPHSKVYKEALYEQTNKRLKVAQASGEIDLTAQDIEEASLRYCLRLRSLGISLMTTSNLSRLWLRLSYLRRVVLA